PSGLGRSAKWFLASSAPSTGLAVSVSRKLNRLLYEIPEWPELSTCGRLSDAYCHSFERRTAPSIAVGCDGAGAARRCEPPSLGGRRLRRDDQSDHHLPD